MLTVVHPADPCSVGVADRDYMRDVPVYRELYGRGETTEIFLPSSRARRLQVGGRAVALWLVLLVAMLVLPRLTILGHHWHVFFLP
jgi:hypothetical protein